MIKIKNLPEHVAIIMDGNRRWATKNHKTVILGHKAGFLAVKDIVRKANDLGIRYISLYAFSTENWSRKRNEVSLLMNLFTSVLETELEELMNENVRIVHIGRKDRIPKRLLNVIEKTEVSSSKNQGITVLLALDYGGRDEIVRAFNKFLTQNQDNKCVTEANFNKYLDTASFPDPDLIIRTSGEKRISNFLIWQSAYSEFIFVDDLMPDFTTERFEKALDEFNRRKRRYGQ